MGSNLVEAPKNFSFRLLLNCLNYDSTAMVTDSFHLYSRSSHNFIVNYHLCKNLFRLTWENAGSYLRVFTVFEVRLKVHVQ